MKRYFTFLFISCNEEYSFGERYFELNIRTHLQKDLGTGKGTQNGIFYKH